MAIKWTQNTTATALTGSLAQRDGTALPISGIVPSQIIPEMKRADGGLPTSFSPIAGVVTIDDVPTAAISIKFAAADVNSPGKFKLQIKVAFGIPIGDWYSDAYDFIISETD